MTTRQTQLAIGRRCSTPTRLQYVAAIKTLQSDAVGCSSWLRNAMHRRLVRDHTINTSSSSFVDSVIMILRTQYYHSLRVACHKHYNGLQGRLSPLLGGDNSSLIPSHPLLSSPLLPFSLPSLLSSSPFDIPVFSLWLQLENLGGALKTPKRVQSPNAC